ncbi:hypothetical protein [Laceyella tengchongensis]|uniref:hypothetical protein n=1 Tax=Laceyella tengchongensis TaxID=574699 RepID=UPI0012B6B42A|nr:hypothetical protein [Laceyella tengchongensis]
MVSWLFKRNWKFRCWLVSLCCSLIFTLIQPVSVTAAPPSPYPILGDYGGEIREKKPRADGLVHVDTPRTIQRLKELHANTYFYLIWHEKSDWDDLRKEFLPAARQAGINVWVYLVPPSEAQLKRSEPFGTDYVAWFRAVGRLGRHFPNLKGIVMDDFNDNLTFFTPTYLAKAKEAGRRENPGFLFYPQIYYPALDTALLTHYRHLFDGVVMSFRDDHYRNTQKTDRMIEQLDEVQARLERARLPFILMIYASRLSATPANPSAQYVANALKLALGRLKLQRLDGVVTYVLHKEFLQEEGDAVAKSGASYANLFAPAVSSHDDAPGHYVEWRQRIYLDPRTQAKLSFWHMSVYPPNTAAGTYTKQVLIDNRVVWQSNITSHASESWVPVTLDLTRVFRGKRQAVLSLRLTKMKKGPAPWTYSGFDCLSASGISLQNGDFEYQGNEWELISSTRNLMGEVLRYDPSRRFRTFQAVRRMYRTFRLHEDLTQWAEHPLLIRKADRLLTCILLDRLPFALHLLEELPGLVLFDRQIPYHRKEALIRDAHQLHHLLDEE